MILLQMRILIVLSRDVDLNPLVATLIERGFECDVVPPATGASRYQPNRHNAVVLLVTDDHLPLQLIRMLRVLGPPRVLTLVSAEHLDATLHPLLDAGVDEVVPFPCPIDDLTLRLTILCRRGNWREEQLRLELELDQARRFQERITDTIPEHIYLFDLVEQHVVYSNHRIDELLGYAKHELARLGDNYYVELMHAEDRENIAEWFARYEDHQPGDPPVITRYRMRHHDGSWRTLYSRSIVFSRSDDDTPRQVLGVVEDITERVMQESALRRSREELRTFARHLQEAREREREAIAREIHDQLGQELTALKLHVSIIEGATRNASPAANDHDTMLGSTMKATRELIERITSSVRRIARDLRPAVIDDVGLAAAMRLHAEEMTRPTRIEHHFVGDPDVAMALDRERATHLFRIFQESITNILRHANARRIDVHLGLDGDDLVLKVRDDGRGIDPADLRTDGRVGLVGMRERALLCRGQIEFRSRPEGGTEVEVRMPMETEDSRDDLVYPRFETLPR
ncbi:MAG: ATP-binding protein [Acidobacteriota bacterium]